VTSLSGRLAGFPLPLLLAACGGGGGGGAATSPAPPLATPPVTTPPVVTPPPVPSAWTAPAGATPATGNYVYTECDAGDYVGAGHNYSFTNANAVLALSTRGLSMPMAVRGNTEWTGEFLLPSAAGTLKAGVYLDLMRTGGGDAAVGGVEWSGDGRGCNKLKGWLAIDKVTVNAGVIEALDLRFEQRCDDRGTGLRGQIHWTNADVNNNPPPGPQAIAASWWQPAASIAPSSGTYVYLESRPGDWVGAGQNYLFTRSNSTLIKTDATGRVSLHFGGDKEWFLEFQGMKGMTQLGAGFYGDLMRYPFHNPVVGGLQFSGDHRSCGRSTGWVAVDKITYSGSIITALDLRFAQYCDGLGSPQYGKVHWDESEDQPPGQWRPGASFVAPAGNYIYLASDPLDYVGGGGTELLTASTATIKASGSGFMFSISTADWQGYFLGPNSLTQLTPGDYGDLQRYPFHDVLKGGIDWTGKGRGCNRESGWFVVDQISYVQGALSSIDLRFEQRCENSLGALHGQIHWAK
jgi:hypothetical protein